MKRKYQDIFTPKCIIEELLEYIPLPDNASIIEPTCGDGNMISRIIKKNKNVNILGIEIQECHMLKAIDMLEDTCNITVINLGCNRFNGDYY